MTIDNNQSDSIETIFFLGAGASVSAGVPTFNNFRKQAILIDKEISSKDEPIIKNLFELVLNYWNENFNESNIEELYEAVEMREMLAEPEIITTKDIEEFIFYTIKKSSIKTENSIGLFEDFLRFSLLFRPSAIITTNWDTILESSRQWPLESGWINYGCVKPYDPISYSEFSDYGPKFCILKLHGSLNWGYCENCGHIYYLTEKISDRLTSLDGVKCNDDNCRENNFNLQRMIVPPKLSKLIKPEPNSDSVSATSPYFKLVHIWKKAYNYLKLCERIFFIGYSFPETDVQMRVLISSTLRMNTNLKEVIIVSSPKHGNSRVNFEERYLSILPKGQLEFYYNTFERFINEK